MVPPRADLSPGDLLVSDRDGRARIAEWQAALGCTPPAETAEHAAVRALAFGTSSSVDVDTTAKVSGAMLEPAGLPEGSIEATFGGASVKGVRFDLIAPSELALKDVDATLSALRAAGASPRSGYEGFQLYLATRVYKAAGTRIEMVADSKLDASAGAAVDGALEVHGKGPLTKESEGTYAFRSAQKLVFGVRLRRLVFKDGILVDKAADKVLKIQGGESSPEDVADFIDGDEAFVELHG